jgi:cytochrome c oxidase cbb3-type subunit 1
MSRRRMSETRSISDSATPTTGTIDASGRVPLLALFAGASLWLLVSAVTALLASMSFHKPDLFADDLWLSYGRILPFSKAALLYGFCLPAGYGLALWLAARLGRTPLAAPAMGLLGALLWNLGVLIGAFGVLCGGSTGYEGMAMPKYAMFMIFGASLLLGFVGLLTVHQRRDRQMYPSLWFVISAFFWFPWILSTAVMLVDVTPVRGVAQAIIADWYLNNLQFVVLGLFGMGAALYFVPKLAGRGLYSANTALFALFTLMVFGSWTGIPMGGPLPAWIGTLSSIAAVFAVVPTLAHFDNVRRSSSGATPAAEAKFFSWSAALLVLAALVAAVSAFVAQTQFTLIRPAQMTLLVQGFFVLIALGGMYHVVPKVADMNWPATGFVRLHFWLAAGGVLLMALPGLIGGWQQGAKLNQPDIAFLDVAKGTLMPIRAASAGELLWALGAVLLALNVFGVILKRARACWRPAVSEMTATMTTAEVKA